MKEKVDVGSLTVGSFFAGSGVQNTKEIGEAFSKVSVSYRAIITASKRYGTGRGVINTLRLQGTRCLMDAALFVPKILAGRAFVAASTMASTAVATTLFNWGADRYFDWWW